MGSNRKRNKLFVVAFIGSILLFCCLAAIIKLDVVKTAKPAGKKTAENWVAESERSAGSDYAGAVEQVEPYVAETKDVEGTQIETSYVLETVEDAAKEKLMAYKALGNCVLVRSEYLDLFGNVWMCIVQGPNWVESVYITAMVDDPNETVSQVKVIRMDSLEWREDAEQALGTDR